MADQTQTVAPGYPALYQSEEVYSYVREVSDTIHDPCAMAMGVALGMNEMGLIREVRASRSGERWDVHVVVRLTSPGCEYFFAFKDNLEQKLREHQQIGDLTIVWDPTLDWTPESLTPRAQARLEERRRELWSGKAPRRGASDPGVIKLQES